jgi:hypothetical protein
MVTTDDHLDGHIVVPDSLLFFKTYAGVNLGCRFHQILVSAKVAEPDCRAGG